MPPTAPRKQRKKGDQKTASGHTPILTSSSLHLLTISRTCLWVNPPVSAVLRFSHLPKAYDHMRLSGDILDPSYRMLITVTQFSRMRCAWREKGCMQCSWTSASCLGAPLLPCTVVRPRVVCKPCLSHLHQCTGHKEDLPWESSPQCCMWLLGTWCLPRSGLPVPEHSWASRAIFSFSVVFFLPPTSTQPGTLGTTEPAGHVTQMDTRDSGLSASHSESCDTKAGSH